MYSNCKRDIRARARTEKLCLVEDAKGQSPPVRQSIHVNRHVLNKRPSRTCSRPNNKT